MRMATMLLAFLALPGGGIFAAEPGLSANDLYKLVSVGDVQLSPDGTRVAYSVSRADRPGRPYSEVFLMNVATGQSIRLGGEKGTASGPRWSPDGQSIAYFGRDGEHAGLMVSRSDGSGGAFIAAVGDTNHPLPSSGERLAWSPDGKRIAFISSTAGPEADANGDPMFITRYLYKPTAAEGLTRFNDNRRLHIFIVDVGAKTVHQATTGNYYEHSIDWSPNGDEILFISNHEEDPDRFFNYDIFALKVADDSVRQITKTKSAEYRPVWSPDGKRIAFLGTKRSLTSSETTMEDTHVWIMNGDGSNRLELGERIDNRQGAPQWSADGKSLYFSVQERGSVKLSRLAIDGGEPRVLVGGRGTVGTWSLGSSGAVAYGFSTPAAPPELYLSDNAGASRALTSLNQTLLGGKRIAETEAITFRARDGLAIEAFLTKPLNLSAGSRHPMIVMIHGGPHGQQGPNFNSKAQVYAAHGYAVLMVNYRGSTGYGQKLGDAIFKDQNGKEAEDVLGGVDAALAKYSWLDGNRLGIEGTSYGGQLTNWIITRTDRFKAAIPLAGISNLITQNYLSYYHDYLAVEFGAFPHKDQLIDLLWERSAIRYAAKVKTPTMFAHGENDNDVPIAEAEQFFIALKDVGVETVMLRYPREGHGLRETKHVIDLIDRSIAWYDRHF